jgi:hypothetical protein
MIFLLPALSMATLVPIPNASDSSVAAHRLQRKNAVAHIPALLTSSFVSPKSAKFSIVSIIPTTLSARGGESIEIEISVSFTPPVFCRFGETVVIGRQTSETSIVCKSPRLRQGEVLLAVSLDKVKWSASVILSVVADDGDISWVVVTIAGFAVLAVALLALRMLCRRRTVPKRRKAKKRKAADVIAHTTELPHRRNPQNVL